MSDKPIYITQPFLPPLEEFTAKLESIWENKILTNGGPHHQKLEKELCDYLGVNHISLFNNATIALIVALQALKIKGEVITTPYSFVATSNSIIWNGLKPVFVDIDRKTLNIDPSKIESSITSETTAIMPVHCYGHPCDVDEIQKIAQRYNLKVIYDAAHAFGVHCHCGSILKHGDLSVLSFHATKVFNTFEGGAIVCPDAKTKNHIDQLKNFGFIDEKTVNIAGINGKMSEINAAFGLVQLKHIDKALNERKKIDLIYRKSLSEVKGITLLDNEKEKVSNYSYFPILINENYPISRDMLYEKLKQRKIYARRYFYPLITDLDAYKNNNIGDSKNTPIAKIAADQILCLPIYHNLPYEDQMRIINIISELH